MRGQRAHWLAAGLNFCSSSGYLVSGAYVCLDVVI